MPTIFRTASRPCALVAAALALSACGASQIQFGGGGPAAPQQQRNTVRAALHAQADHLLSGGTAAFAARLVSLRGTPVVVNQWASWCAPCRFEFPFFGHLATRYAGRIAFLGVDSQDARGDALAFLGQLPVPYPHYSDEDASVARTFKGGRAWPTTAFFAASGRLVFTHVGSYATEARLGADIVRYALHG